MVNSQFSPNFKSEPFWWQAAPRPAPPKKEKTELSDEVDVLVVGSGYTGLHTALRTARAGLNTLVVDADLLGAGCSSRNGGQVSTSVKGDYLSLAKKYGEKQAYALLNEGVEALNFLETFIQEENIECNWHRSGHFSGAHNPSAYEATARRLETLPKDLGIQWQMIPQQDQHKEIGSDRYFGGVLYPEHGALQPAQYHNELLYRVQKAGAITIGGCPVVSINKQQHRYDVHTNQGVVRAGKVALATNGYSKELSPWHQRRIIPIGSYIIATAPVEKSITEEIAPNGRTMTDTRRLVFYYRMFEQRMIFGGRVALSETNPRVSAPKLHQAMSDIFPQLKNTPIDYSWLGFVGFTFDTLPHIGQRDGIHYAMGYCGSGISLSSYLGSLMGNQIIGEGQQHSPFMDINFPTRPLYTGNPWFLNPSILYYKLRDRLNF